MTEQLIEPAAPVAPKPAPPRMIPPSKTETLRKLLSRRNGATLAQLQNPTWLAAAYDTRRDLATEILGCRGRT